ncbi:MAG: 50S ribosomal protein L28 [Candidatus Omnitrophica bacterium]|nr:50S ribosomal protein L28 [Candidatus Omnitrophota bacterium]
MSRMCQICHKKPLMGNQIARRGISKKAGGIGLKTTGINRRRFLPNLQTVRAVTNGTVRRIRVCAKCLKAGKVIKASPRNYVPASKTAAS